MAGRSGRTLADLEISGPAFVVTGTNEEDMAESAVAPDDRSPSTGRPRPIAPVLDLHGWGELQTELNAMSKRGEWAEMGTLIDDDMLDTFAVVAEPAQLGPALHARYGDIVDRLSFYAPYQSDPDTWLPVLDSLKHGGS